MFKCKKNKMIFFVVAENHQTLWHLMNKKRTNKSKTKKAWRHGINLDVK